MGCAETLKLNGSNGVQNLNSSIRLLSYWKEEDRLESFTLYGWKKENIDISALARFGFYFLSEPDYTRCHFCKLTIHDWLPNDDILNIHRDNSHGCPLLRRRSTQNVPIDPVRLDRELPPLSYDVCGHNYNKESNYNYDHMKEEKRRLDTFKYWPKSMKQRKEDMVEAGFFYTERGDRVVCFSCGIGLKDWEENDIPWIEHAKASNNCHYMISMKGQEFIDNVQKGFLNSSKLLLGTSSSKDSSSDDNKCKICYEKPIEVTLDPCGHCLCKKCSLQLVNCPICRQTIKKRINLFFS